jgi:hypothetical protein
MLAVLSLRTPNTLLDNGPQLICRITKISLVAGGRDVLVYTTISGAVGALVPFASMDDVEFMTTLEMVRRSDRSLHDELTK